MESFACIISACQAIVKVQSRASGGKKKPPPPPSLAICLSFTHILDGLACTLHGVIAFSADSSILAVPGLYVDILQK